MSPKAGILEKIAEAVGNMGVPEALSILYKEEGEPVIQKIADVIAAEFAAQCPPEYVI